jgi:hypothetical protein
VRGRCGGACQNQCHVNRCVEYVCFFGEGIVDLVLGCSYYWIDCKAELLYVCLFIVLSIDVVQVWCKVKAVSVIEKSVK